MKQIRGQHALAYALAAAAVSVVCFSLVPENLAFSLVGAGVAPEVTYALLQAALVACALLMLYVPTGAYSLEGPLVEQTRQRGISVRATLLIVLGAAAAVGVAKVVVQGGDVAASLLAAIAFAVMLGATAVFEEILFRGLLFEGFAKTFFTMGTKNNALLAAAIASSAVFGIMHVTSDLGSLFRLTAYLQAAAKIAEGTLFGMVMCALYVKMGSVWPCVALHFFFDVLSEGPVFVTTGIQTSTYITGSPVDLAIVAGAAVALLLPAKWSFEWLKVQ